ncbi:MAG: type II secretion system protein [Candidatus Manganitrophus sp.]|nr:MAG: type II secretion system protein [Candidatus Manganitrophus sp.]WDT82123.1 MAG: type II secretion system protein [Candidatus Manganitrophus sp.]
MKTLKNEKGFTLVELVVVIAVLGILAVVAVPRFINITTSARTASVNGMAGAVRAAVALARSQYMVTGNMTATTVSMDGTNVNVTAGTGVPRSATGGIDVAVQSFDGFTYTSGTPSTFWPTVGGSATCGLSYADGTGAVTVTTTTC